MASRSFGKSTTERAHREQQRLDALNDLDLLDTPKDASFERIVWLIQQVFAVDIAIVSVIDAHRQWYQACNGLPNTEVAREESFCRFVVESEEPLIIQDASKDPRLCDNPAVTGEAQIRFYAGVPLKTKHGFTLGTVCAIDQTPKSFSCKDVAILEKLAELAMDRIELLQRRPPTD